MCVPKSPSCREYEEGGRCRRCEGEFRIYEGRCYKIQAVCATSNSLQECTGCYQGYVLSGKTCVVRERERERERGDPFCDRVG